MNKVKKLLFPALVFVLCRCQIASAQGSDPPLPPPQDIAARLNQLEQETQALRGEVQWLREHPVRLPETAVTPTGMANVSTTSEMAEGNYVTREELPGEIKKFAWKKGDFTIRARPPSGRGRRCGSNVHLKTSPGAKTRWSRAG